jgi:glycosyltransferase involved in cell wall biosynthesis
MRVSLIITTYNWKEALAVVLASALAQTRLPEEIIVADDGSGDGTERVVAEFAARAPVPVIHCWQEDKGFRAAMCRNRAIARACGRYIILVDGDIVMESHFVEDHLAAARRGFFVQGGRVLLDERQTSSALAGDGVKCSLFAKGLGNRKNCFRSRLLCRIASGASRGLGGIKTCNLAFFREDALTVNGFDEDFVGWGREDSDFAARLLNSGLRRRTLRFAAVAMHLHHPVQSRDRLGRNDERLEETIRLGKVRCLNGIEQYLAEEDRAVPAGNREIPLTET